VEERGGKKSRVKESGDERKRGRREKQSERRRVEISGRERRRKKQNERRRMEMEESKGEGRNVEWRRAEMSGRE
jgi:hypothetical protein